MCLMFLHGWPGFFVGGEILLQGVKSKLLRYACDYSVTTIACLSCCQVFVFGAEQFSPFKKIKLVSLGLDVTITDICLCICADYRYLF
jgi:hypothetical protein